MSALVLVRHLHYTDLLITQWWQCTSQGKWNHQDSGYIIAFSTMSGVTSLDDGPYHGLIKHYTEFCFILFQ